MSAAETPQPDILNKYRPIADATKAAEEARTELNELLSKRVGKYASEDASLVVFGSLARDEWTSRSDLDWTYLIDGQAVSSHLSIAQKIQAAIAGHKDAKDKEKFPAPGQTGTFGNIAFSHELVHRIGGQDDTNRNMTQRVLLLLESKGIGDRTEAYDRVLRAVIERYLEEDNHLLASDGKSYRVPRFLLNDIVRFWRTMAVDFASKQRDRGGKGWGLRNAKLRMSRKLIFASGLLTCFSCQLDSELRSRIPPTEGAIKLPLVKHIRQCVSLTPLQVLANAVREYKVADSTADELFSSYAEFLALLDDQKQRDGLDHLRAEDSRKDKLFGHVRSLSERFQKALDNIFFENSVIRPLTRKYGVF